MKNTTITRISKRRLYQYRQTMTRRDQAVLRSIQICHYLKTDQVQRLHFGDAATPSAALRAATRTLTKLCSFGLVQPLQRRIGGVRAGSTSYVWTLKTAGVELLHLGKENPAINPRKPAIKYRKRIYEPTHIFLKHTLAIAEVFVRLKTMEKIQLLKAEFEPSCWRGYTNAFGVDITLKPDLYAVTTSDASDDSDTCRFEDHWFLEVDLDTEAPTRIIQKCDRYGRYYLTGNEQRQSGVFPRVVWIVPDEKRKQTIIQHVSRNLSEYTDLFAVINFQELDALIRKGNGN